VRVLQRLRVALAAEFLGSALLLAAVVGSGIMAQRLAQGNTALALLANAIATGGVLFAIIAAFGPLSGAHFNPAVTLGDAWLGGLPWSRVPAYVAAQLTGALTGVIAANAMFALPAVTLSTHARHGFAQLLAEGIATFGLLSIIWCCSRNKSAFTGLAVAGYIVGAYWFTASTSFANPAVTVARALSNTFAGIAPADVVPFIFAQLTGAAAATALFIWLGIATKATSLDLMVEHE
jgi:glycerol uptake facilitator-like aquaporin